MPGTPLPSGVRRRPLPPPVSPIERTGARADLLAQITETVVSGLERAVADDAAARERLARAPGGATGRALDGAVEVRVDGKAMLVEARFGPEVAGSTPEELRELTLTALQEARGTLGLPTASSSLEVLHRRDAADAILRLLEEARPGPSGADRDGARRDR